MQVALLMQVLIKRHPGWPFDWLCGCWYTFTSEPIIRLEPALKPLDPLPVFRLPLRSTWNPVSVFEVGVAAAALRLRTSPAWSLHCWSSKCNLWWVWLGC